MARRGTVVYAHSSRAPLDAVSRIYSMTKPVIAVAVLQLWEQGKFLLSDPIHLWLPAYEKVTFQK